MLPLFRHFPSPQKLGKSYSCPFVLRFMHTLLTNPSPRKSTELSALLQARLPPSQVLQIHAQIFQAGAHQDNLITTRLIGHYPSVVALRVFHQLQTPNIFPFNAIIRVLAEEGNTSLAFSLFRNLKRFSLSPNDFTFSFLLKACFRSNDAGCVKQVHSHVVKVGFLDDSFVCSGLLMVYAKGLKNMASAHRVFDEMIDRSMVSCWTSLIAGYAQLGEIEEVLRLFIKMVNKNLQPTDDTLVSVLSACSNLEMIKIENWVTILLELIDNLDLQNLGRDSVNTVLVYLYGKWGMVENGKEIFDRISDKGKRSVLPWNAMVGAYAQNGCPMDALSLFRLMIKHPNHRPNHVTMVSVLSACAQIGDLDLGKWVHEYLESQGRNGIISSNKILATALIDMYSKCGNFERAKEVFNQIVSKDVVSFNVMIMGLAMNSEGREALRLFFNMQEFGLQPNAGTFLGLLCACNHSGLTEEGRQIFMEMTSRFYISPKLEHYACYIDLLARVGLVEEAHEVANSMPFDPNNFIWGALLGGCLLHSKVELAKDISKRLVQVDPESSSGYVMFANALAFDHRWADVTMLRWIMKEKGVVKQPGCSWISIDGVVHEFLVGCPSNPQIESICQTLKGLTMQMKAISPQRTCY
ncbi:pentatricopeptide repeat-containing protein At1g08070, chloroplastic [Ziziphus jujuba]|uniref:Pentatricopeptide repeat-containing protein At1g08070, chloroplastic n=1 Tax=Ziziphus jujuba TaxID=326968 RepID=A0ABM4AI36_ZIZJJ|nr:pentatricopeptide repeat-containing protein At1g08070, chloroplastic [Ziziphus jujuba]